MLSSHGGFLHIAMYKYREHDENRAYDSQMIVAKDTAIKESVYKN